MIAIGKAALTMFEGAEAGFLRAGASIAHALVVGPDGTVLPRSTKRVVCMHAAHPLPDARSVKAADRALRLAGRAGRVRGTRGNLLVLVSGGASSLVSKPAGMSLARKREVVNALLRAGATIEEVNLVRRHASAIKGGGLLRAAGRARVVTLVVSDVLADAPWDVGSGPATPDPTTRAAARAVLRRRVPELSRLPLRETLAPRASLGVDTELVASPGWFACELAHALTASGLRCRALPPSNAEVGVLAARYMQTARKMKPGTAILRAAEPSVTVPQKAGKGGRCTQLAALVSSGLPPGVVFLAGATDGVDGSSGTAGAVVHAGSFAARPEARAKAIERFDAGPLHVRAGTALPSVVSGVNFADVHVLARLA